MGANYLSNPATFLIEIIFGLYALLVLLRFLLQVTRADFYNPLSQFIVKATSPLLLPLRKIIPGFGGIDTSSLILAWVVKTIELTLIIWITNSQLNLLLAMGLAIPALIELTINIFIYSILIVIIISWINPTSYNPAVGLLNSLTEPVTRPFKKIIPTFSGMDFSSMVAMIALTLLKMLLIPPINQLFFSLFR